MNTRPAELAVDQEGLRIGSTSLVGALAITAGFYLASLYNFLLFHSFAELFSILVAFATFLIAWNTRRFLTNSYLLLVGIALFFVGTIDLVHTLAYKGMGVFPETGANLPTQLWIAARYLESGSFVLAGLLFGRRLSARITLAGYGLATALLLYLVSQPGLFPGCYIDGVGLTPFKIGSEYIICLLLALSLILLWRRRREFPPETFHLLVGAIILTIGSELAFTFYVSVYGLSNLIGHILKIAAFYLIYRAIVQTGLVRPYALIFHNLQQSEASLARTNQELEERVAQRTADLTRANTLLQREVEKHRQTATDLRQAEEKYRNIVENAAEGILQMTPEGRLLMANPALATMLGFPSPAALLEQGSAVPRLFFPDSRTLERFLQLLDAHDVIRDFETGIRRADGSLIWVSMNVRTVRDAKGNALYYEGTVADISDRRTAEEGRSYLAAIVEASDDAIIGKGMDGTIVSWNRGAEALYGYQAGQVIGCSVALLMPPDAANELPRILARIRAGERVDQYETKRVHKDGRIIDVSLTVSPIRGPDGNVIGASSIAKDITWRKRLEAQLQQAQRLEAIGTLTGGIAHDFNNILTAIIGFASLLDIKMPAGDPLHDNVKQILASAERAANLTRSLLTFSRKQTIEVRPVDLNAVVDGLEKLLRRVIRENIELHFNLAADELTVLADPGQLEQVLLNLATNASDALVQGGQVIVSTEEQVLDESFRTVHGFGTPGRRALLTFSDNGRGMEERVRQRIFEPFFTTKEVGKGTGLGLAVCYGIIEQHHGSIICESAPGAGTTFRVYLPLADAPDEPVPTPETAPPAGGTETILVAEDDETLRQLISNLLEEAGYSVLAVADGEAAVAAFGDQRRSFDLCVFDLVMPKCSGWEAFAAIRALRPGIRTIFMSGYQPEVLDQEGLNASDADFLLKPVMPRDLLRKVREVLDRPGPTAEAAAEDPRPDCTA